MSFRLSRKSLHCILERQKYARYSLGLLLEKNPNISQFLFNFYQSIEDYEMLSTIRDLAQIENDFMVWFYTFDPNSFRLPIMIEIKDFYNYEECVELSMKLEVPISIFKEVESAVNS